jgi:hypothetical protein
VSSHSSVMAARLRLLCHINLLNIQPDSIVAFLDAALASCVIVCRKPLVTRVGTYMYLYVHSAGLSARITTQHMAFHAP